MPLLLIHTQDQILRIILYARYVWLLFRFVCWSFSAREFPENPPKNGTLPLSASRVYREVSLDIQQPTIQEVTFFR